MRPEISEAEAAVLGSCMADPQALRDVAGILGGEHFADERCRVIFERMRALMMAAKPFDVVSVGTALDKRDLEIVGGIKGLFELANLVPAPLNVRHYAESLVKAHELRKIVESAQAITKEPDSEAAQAAMRQALMGAQAARGSGVVTKIGDAMGPYLDLMDRRIMGQELGFMTPLPSLNRISTGLHKGTLWTFGARTSRGKSSILLKIAHKAAKAGTKVLYVSAEMTATELLDRILALATNIPLMTLRTRAVGAVKGRVTDAMGSLYGLPLVFVCGGKLTLDRILVEVEMHQPEILVVDYLQRFSSSGADSSRAAFFSDVANGLKGLAMDKKIAVVTASQLSRSIELRDDQTPTLADLKESGGIEEASDLIVFINVPADSADGIRTGEFIVAKHRNGPLGRFPVAFHESTTDFREIDESDTIFAGSK